MITEEQLADCAQVFMDGCDKIANAIIKAACIQAACALHPGVLANIMSDANDSLTYTLTAEDKRRLRDFPLGLALVSRDLHEAVDMLNAKGYKSQ